MTTTRGWPWLLLTALSGCTTPSPPPATPPPAHVAQLPAPTATPTAPATPTPSSIAAPSFEQVSAELDSVCAEAEADNNIEAKLAAARANDCRRKRVEAEVAAVADDLAEQALWQAHVEALCHLTEENGWTDLAGGTRTHGTLYGYAELGCKRSAYAERLWFIRARASSDAFAVRTRARDLRPAGERALASLDLKRGQLAKLTPSPRGDETMMWPLDADDLASLSELVDKIPASASALAELQCQRWAELRDAHRSQGECHASLTRYHLSLYDDNPYAPG